MTDPGEPEGAAPPAQGLLARLLPGRSLVEIEALVPDLAVGARAAVATILPLSMSVEHARPELAWMALGGWLGTLADPGGSRRARARALVAFALLGALDVAFCESSVRSVAGGAALLAIVAFFATMLRALGAAASTLGTMLAILAALGTSARSADPARDALWFAAGSGVAVVLSSIVWPVWTHLPVRRAVAQVFRDLERYALGIERCAAAGAPEDHRDWSLLGREHPRRLREAIEAARAMSVAIRARRAGESRMGSNLRVLLGMAESQFLLLVSLSTELEAEREPEPALAARAALGRLARRHELTRAILVSRAWRPRVPPPAAAPGGGAAGVLAELCSHLEHESESALALAGSLDRAEAAASESAERPESPDPAMAVEWSVLRDAFSARSPILHHAVRVAAAGAAAAIAGALLSPAHGPWVSVTTIVILQPYTGATVRRAAERVAGTVVGSLVAIAITSTRLGPHAIAAVMFPLSVAAVATRPRSYRLFTLFLTPIFVLAATRVPGDWRVAAERATDALVGGGIALGAALLLFPGWEERVGLPEALTEMVKAAEGYRDAAVGALGGHEPGPAGSVAAARLLAAAATNRAEASLERLLADPLHDRKGEARAMQLVTYARRLTLACTTLHIVAARQVPPRGAPVEAALARVHRFAELLRRSADEGAGPPAPPPRA